MVLSDWKSSWLDVLAPLGSQHNKFYCFITTAVQFITPSTHYHSLLPLSNMYPSICQGGNTITVSSQSADTTQCSRVKIYVWPILSSSLLDVFPVTDNGRKLQLNCVPKQVKLWTASISCSSVCWWFKSSWLYHNFCFHSININHGTYSLQRRRHSHRHSHRRRRHHHHQLIIIIIIIIIIILLLKSLRPGLPFII